MQIKIPSKYNYIAAFLTMKCNLHCSYCINNYSKLCKTKSLTGKQWVDVINKIQSRNDLPVTLQGGEPTQHPDFYYIVNNIKPELNIDLITNMQFDIYEFMKNIKPDRIKRNAPYASIRISYHPEQMDIIDTINKATILSKNNYSVGIWVLNHPKWEIHNATIKKLCSASGIDCREKDFLGYTDNKLYGTYKYPDAISGKIKNVQCKTTELLISENGSVYKCHSDLYQQINSIGSALDNNFLSEYKFRDCSKFGLCNPCDIKLKFDRFQKEGHCSVQIKEI